MGHTVVAREDGAREADQPRDRPARDAWMPRAVGNRVQRRLANRLEPGGQEHLQIGRAIGQPPLREPARSVEPGERTSAMKQREAELDLIRAEKFAPADAVDCLQCPQWISQVQQQAATHHDVELPDRIGIQVVDAARLWMDGGAQQLPRDPEAGTQSRAGDIAHVLGSPLAKRQLPVPLLVRGDVDRDHLSGAPALELEGEEAIGGPDVQTALAPHLGPWQPVDDRAADRTRPGSPARVRSRSSGTTWEPRRSRRADHVRARFRAGSPFGGQV